MRRMLPRANWICLWALAACLALAAPATAQPGLPPKPGALVGEEKRTRDELEAAGRLAADRRWDDAIKRYQQILAESGDLLVTAPDDSRQAIPARWLVHQRIAALPEEARKVFRNGVESAARKWLEQGSANRDPRLLEQIVAEAFCSKSAEQALHLLGDLAFERGEFEVAEHYWRMLSRYPSEAGAKANAKGSFELLYPDPASDGALAQAKLILALLFRGENARARSELEIFSKQRPSAEGHFAGKQGKFADILRGLIAADGKWNIRGKTAASTSWLTFAGDPSRNLVVPYRMTPYFSDAPTWLRTLPGDPKAKPHKDADPPAGTGAAARSLAFEPVIVPGYVLVADAARVFAYHLATGEPAAEFDYRSIAATPESLDLRVPSRTDARYTLTVAGDLIYARVGAQPMRSAQDPSKLQEIDSAIICLSLDRDGKEAKLHFRWQIRARTLDTDPAAMFEGAPLVHGGRLYVAKTQFDGRQAISSIQCFDADNPDGGGGPPALRWKQDLWTVEAPTEPVRHRHDLLTLAGPNVVYCTHSGAVIALDAVTGKRAWAYRYKFSTSKPPDGVQPHDLCPCVAANGRIFAAPADSDRILCLDARSGRLVWEVDGVNVVQLLGVSNGSLFVTLGGFPHGIRSYQVSDGKVIWQKPDEGDRAAFGRGFISDRWIFWPTRQGLRVLRQDDGELVHAASNDEPWGNLCFGEGCLIAATPTEIWGFVPDRYRLGQLHTEREQNPENALARYRLALAEADAGHWDKALSEFRKAEELAGGEWLADKPLVEAARHRRHEILIVQAEEAWNHDRKDEAFARLREASGEPFALSDRIRAWLFRERAGDHSYPDLLENREIHSLWLTDRDGLPVRADAYLLTQLDGKGRQQWEEHAAARLAKNPDEAIRLFPNAKAVQGELLRRARKAEEVNQLAEAAANYRLMHESGLSGLAAVYDRAGYKDLAQTLRRRLDPEKFPAVNSPSKSHLPNLNFPLKPAATFELSSRHEWPLGPLRNSTGGDDPSPISEEGCAFFFDTHQVICRSLTSGAAVWSQAIEHDACCCAFQAESAIVAGPNGVSRLRRGDGRIAWEFRLPDSRRLPAAFPDPDFHVRDAETAAPAFSSFCLAGSRLYFRWGEQRVLALDVESGEIAWQLWAPGAPLRSVESGGGLNEHFLATADYLLLQTTGGECLAVEANDGRILHRRSAPAAWPGPPVAIDSHRAIFPAESDRIQAMELATGREIWSRSPEHWRSLSGGAPQLRRDGSQLFAAIERNYGYELERWAIDTGRSIEQPINLGRDRVDLAASAFGVDALVLVGEHAVAAYDRQSGKLRWEFPLPRRGSERWIIRPTHSALLLFPETALPQVDLDWLARRAGDELAGIPSFARFQTAASMLYHGYLRRTFPLLAVDPKAGKKMQELSFPAIGPRNALLLGERAAVNSDGKLIRFD